MHTAHVDRTGFRCAWVFVVALQHSFRSRFHFAHTVGRIAVWLPTDLRRAAILIDLEHASAILTVSAETALVVLTAVRVRRCLADALPHYAGVVQRTDVAVVTGTIVLYMLTPPGLALVNRTWIAIVGTGAGVRGRDDLHVRSERPRVDDGIRLGGDLTSGPILRFNVTRRTVRSVRHRRRCRTRRQRQHENPTHLTSNHSLCLLCKALGQARHV